MQFSKEKIKEKYDKLDSNIKESASQDFYRFLE